MTRRHLLLGLAVLATGLGDRYHPDMVPDLVRSRHRRASEPEPGPAEPAAFWMRSGEEELDEALGLTANTRLAKNLVLVIGDGMSLSTVAGGRVYKGQRRGRDGASTTLSWDRFPHVGLSRTYTTNSLVPDSAATAFSMYSGVKTNFYTMGYDSNIQLRSVDSMLRESPVSTVLDWAQEARMATGLVTTARVTHATPAALYAKTAHRDWECDTAMPESARGTAAWDITRQLVDTERGRRLAVVLGGGRASFTPATNSSQQQQGECVRGDGVDMVARWRALHPAGSFVTTGSELAALDTAGAEAVLGLFSWGHMPYDDEIRESGADTPSLANMTAAALEILLARSKQQQDSGFFLMVEGGRIDHANHYALATRALSETVAMDQAVETVLARLGAAGQLEDSLVLVTADHGHTLSVAGYPGRTADIRGVVTGDSGWVMRGDDGRPLSILSYANGPGFKKLRVEEGSDTRSWEAISRAGDLGEGELADTGFVFPGAVPLEKETHGGEDVGVFARGPWAHLVHGVHQQSYLGHLMSYAACIGPHQGRNPQCSARARH